jgi:hypothetical protein
LKAIATPRITRGTKIFILDVLNSLVGTAVLEFPLHSIFLVHSKAGILHREAILSIFCAGLLGFMAYWKWRSATSKMAWILFVLFFGFGILISADKPGGYWGQLSGSACAVATDSFSCARFWLFTVSLIRGLSYSCGAFLASCIYGSQQYEPHSRMVQQ